MKRMVAVITIIVLLMVAAFDTYAMLTVGESGTISWIIWETSVTHPIVPFAAGVICGHLFWQMRGRQ